MDLAALVKNARRGDKAAFLRLVEPKRESLYRIALSYLHNPDDSMDILQDTMVRALTSLHSLRQTEYFYSWITRILINLCCTQLKKSRKYVIMSNVNQVSDSGNGCSKLVDQKIDLARMLNTLDDKYRRVIILKYMGDYTLREISEIIQCPIGTVKSRLNYGLTELRKKHDWGDPK